MRKLVLLLATLLVLGLMAGPAAAHHLWVDAPGEPEAEAAPHSEDGGWVGALDIPGEGEGLVPGGPDGSWSLTPAHDGGLNEACERLEDNPSVVDIRGPGPGCEHAAPGD